MGKSEIENLRPNRLNLRLDGETIMKSWHNQQNKKQSKNEPPKQILLPPNMELFNNQVAGHMHTGQQLGMIMHTGKVLKPITIPLYGEREIQLYEELNKSKDPVLQEMKNYVPQYYGTETLNIGGNRVKCIVLDDVTKDLKEPCIVDIKIGKRTYDPLASYDKIINEDQKYHETKRDLGFCIPGFQVHKLSNGRICKYGKDYGKQLNKDTVKEALKIFLNASSGLNRGLLVQFLASLWSIQNWVRKQRKFRFYSSSLLLMYDARKLRQNLQHKQNIKDNVPQPNPKALKRSTSLYRPMSLATLNNSEHKTGFSGQLTKDGPILQSATSPTRIKDFVPFHDQKLARSLKRMHSFQNNYDADMQSVKRDYVFILDELVNEKRNQAWASVKIIDFAHTFPAENNGVDTNFLEGIENLISIFEQFLSETDWNNCQTLNS